MKATTTFFYDWITKGRLFFSNDGDKDDREKTNNSGEIADDHVRSVKKNVQNHHEAYRILPGPIPTLGKIQNETSHLRLGFRSEIPNFYPLTFATFLCKYAYPALVVLLFLIPDHDQKMVITSTDKV